MFKAFDVERWLKAFDQVPLLSVRVVARPERYPSVPAEKVGDPRLTIAEMEGVVAGLALSLQASDITEDRSDRPPQAGLPGVAKEMVIHALAQGQTRRTSNVQHDVASQHGCYAIAKAVVFTFAQEGRSLAAENCVYPLCLRQNAMCVHDASGIPHRYPRSRINHNISPNDAHCIR